MSEPQFQHIRVGLEQGVLTLAITDQQVQGDQLSDGLRKEFFQALEQSQGRHVVVDLGQVKYLGSAGFRPLLSLYRRVRDQGGSMVLCNLNPDVEEVFRITRLISTSRSFTAPFETAPSLQEAVAHLQQT
jgi:stage II sporulation protein AA (anti-sigma F factor antagonist)